MEDCFEEHGQERSEKDDSDINTTPDTARKLMDVCSTSPDTTSEEGDFLVVKHSRAMRALTRKGIEERAWVKARLKFHDGNFACAPPPPTHVDVSGLYTLITEVNVEWMPKDLLNDPQACLQFLHKMVEDGTLGVELGSAFGTWYLYGVVV